MKSDISNVIAQTMTLKEITDLLNTRHNDAMGVVERLAKDPEFGDTKKTYFEIINNLGFKVKYETYLLEKRQSIAVGARLNTALLMRVIDRWQELEAQSQKPKYNLAFIERAMMNRAAIKDGYFSVIDVVSDKIICGLEQMGAVFPEKFCPDISVGILWAKYLKNTGRSPESVGAIKYNHRYPKPKRRVVEAWQYPNVLCAEFMEWLRSDWMSNHMYRYFSGKDKELMLLADKAIKAGWLPKPTIYLN